MEDGLLVAKVDDLRLVEVRLTWRTASEGGPYKRKIKRRSRLDGCQKVREPTPRLGRGVAGQNGASAGGDGDAVQGAWGGNGAVERAEAERSGGIPRKQGSVRSRLGRREPSVPALHNVD